MSAHDYEGRYDPHKNPKSSMDRVLSNCNIDFTGRVSLQDGVIVVDLDGLTASLLAEADKAGFTFWRADGTGQGYVEARFEVDG